MRDESDYEYQDALPDGLARRRGAGLNPGNRFELTRFHRDGDDIDRQQSTPKNSLEHLPEAPSDASQKSIFQPKDAPRVNVPLTVIPDKTVKVINRVARTSDVPFDWTVNPYRGCEHGCIYCFARPYHEYLGFSCGLDFETKIVAKHDAPDMLKYELSRPSWKAEPIVMSAITDIYQPLEKRLVLARGCLEVMADCGQPVSTLTKGALVLRDVELWQKLSAMQAGRVSVTIVTLDDGLAKRLEPRAASPTRRLAMIRELSQAGVAVSAIIAPVIPALTDSEMPRILEAVADAGAKRVGWVMLRLPYQLKALFEDWLRREIPDRADHVLSRLRQAYGGKLYDARQEVRRRGFDQIAYQIRDNFEVFTRKYHLNQEDMPISNHHFRRPRLDGQMSLFGGE